MAETIEVKEFYNKFIDRRMIGYRLHGNPRISEAAKLAKKYISPNSRILDIGCGIGIATEQISKKNTKGLTWACDISDKNISYAKKTVDNKNILFFVADVVEEFEKVKDLIKESVDIITMFDVIEHLPPGNLNQLFKNFSKITSDNAAIILTYPSPEFQNYLEEKQPEELQVIDENIEIDVLIENAKAAGFKLSSFSYTDLGRKNQYIHCVLLKNIDYKNEFKISNTKKIIGMLERIYRKILFPYFNYKYIYKPSREED